MLSVDEDAMAGDALLMEASLQAATVSSSGAAAQGSAAPPPPTAASSHMYLAAAQALVVHSGAAASAPGWHRGTAGPRTAGYALMVGTPSSTGLTTLAAAVQPGFAAVQVPFITARPLGATGGSSSSPSASMQMLHAVMAPASMSVTEVAAAAAAATATTTEPQATAAATETGTAAAEAEGEADGALAALARLPAEERSLLLSGRVMSEVRAMVGRAVHPEESLIAAGERASKRAEQARCSIWMHPSTPGTYGVHASLVQQPLCAQKHLRVKYTACNWSSKGAAACMQLQ